MKKLIYVFLAAFMLGCVKNDTVVKKVPKTVYYRVKQVDKDGKTTYSKVVTTKE